MLTYVTTWASLLIPAGSVAVGGLITGGFAVWSQNVIHLRTSERDREARYEAFTIRRYELEREVLVALQDALERHVMLYNRFKYRDQLEEGDEKATRIDLVAIHSEVVKLANRTMNIAAGLAALEYIGLTSELSGQLLKVDDNEAYKQAGAAWTKAVTEIGKALRMDPLSGATFGRTHPAGPMSTHT
jgi:hypothetical protein